MSKEPVHNCFKGQPDPPSWTSNPPDKPGWYWAARLDEGAPYCLEISPLDIKERAGTNPDCHKCKHWMDDYTLWYSEPVIPPKDPTP